MLNSKNFKQVSRKNLIWNSTPRDSSAKKIFGDSTLCAQFLRDYVDIPMLKTIEPEDIEDVTTRYPPILPILFYDGPDNWTAATKMHDRVLLSDVLGEYILGVCYEINKDIRDRRDAWLNLFTRDEPEEIIKLIQ